MIGRLSENKFLSFASQVTFCFCALERGYDSTKSGFVSIRMKATFSENKDPIGKCVSMSS